MPDDMRPESPMPAPHIGGLHPSEARETVLALRAAAVRLYGHEGHPPSDVQRMVAEVERLRGLVAYLCGRNTDHVGVAICGNPTVVDEIVTRAAAALEGKP